MMDSRTVWTVDDKENFPAYTYTHRYAGDFLWKLLSILSTVLVRIAGHLTLHALHLITCAQFDDIAAQLSLLSMLSSYTSFVVTKLLKTKGMHKLSRHFFQSWRKITTCGVVEGYSNEIWSVIPRASAMCSNFSIVTFFLPQLMAFRYCWLMPIRAASSVSLTFFSPLLSSSQFWLSSSLLRI